MVIFIPHNQIYESAALVKWPACLTANHEVSGSIQRTLKILKWIRSGAGFTKLHEDNWITT